MSRKATQATPAAAPAPAIAPAKVRVYADINPEVDRAMEIAAVSLGKTKKAFIEGAILSAVETAKDEMAGQSKGKK